MNGTIYEKIKKNGDTKKKEKLKIIVALISTNSLVAFLCLSLGPSDSHTSPSKVITKILHPHFKMLVLPLTILIDIDPNSLETPVTLMNKSKKILIPKAYLHEMLPAGIKDQEISPRFKIEIPEGEVLKLSTDDPEAMMAIPELKYQEKVTKPVTKRVSKYEISL